LTTELIGCGVLLLTGLACSAWVAYGSAPVAVTVLPANLASFALGMTLAVMTVAIKPGTKAWYRTERAFGTPWKAWLVAAIAFSATVWAVHYPAVLPITNVIPGSEQMYYLLLIDVMGLFVVLPAVFGNQLRGAGRRVLRATPIVFLGVISYGIYLWHVPMIDEAQKLKLFGASHAGGFQPHFDFFEVTLVILVMTVAVATASWFLLERPLIRFSHRPRLLAESIGKWQRAVFRRRGAAVVSGEGDTSLESATAD
jgi:peptidoglycan/LPS O-acetylase OafA/YrhL